jgi:hypothetical protein
MEAQPVKRAPDRIIIRIGFQYRMPSSPVSIFGEAVIGYARPLCAILPRGILLSRPLLQAPDFPVDFQDVYV